MSQENYEALATEFKNATEQVKGLGEELKAKMAGNEKCLDDLKGRVDEALTAMNSAKSRLDELEQKATRRGYGVEQEKSIPRLSVVMISVAAFSLVCSNAGLRNGLAGIFEVPNSTKRQ